jgi:hypothetical protein
VPVIKNGLPTNHPLTTRNQRSGSLMLCDAQKTGRFDYDTNYLDLNMFIKNLKTSTIELNERFYVDKPLKRQKDMPIEN